MPSGNEIFLCPDNNLSKHQWIFTKLGMCIYIVEVRFGIVGGQILSNFDRGMCIYIVEVWFGIVDGQILSNFDRAICP